MSSIATTTLPWIGPIIDGLLGANIAIPIIFATVMNMIAMFRSLVGGPDLPAAELANIIEQKLAENDERGRAEIARLRALLGL